MLKLNNWIFNYEEHKGVAFGFRKNRGIFIQKFIKSLRTSPTSSLKILDVGGTEMFWQSVGIKFLRQQQVKITLLNFSIVPLENPDIFTSCQGDGTKLHFSDNAFDLCFSNSVIEHVGDFEKMFCFASEMRRVAPNYYCQTPNFWFPIEPHFFFLGFQFLPDPIRALLLTHFKLGTYIKQSDIREAYLRVQSVKLIDFKALTALFGDADTILRERFLFFTKSLIAVKGCAC